MDADANFYLYMSVPAAYALAFTPHLIKFLTMLAHQGPSKYNNLTPRSVKLDETFKSDPALVAFLQRCAGAHLNGSETLSFFAPAVVAAMAARVPSTTSVPLVNSFLGLRVLYTVLYMSNTNMLLGSLRTVTYFASVGCAMGLYLAAAKETRALKMFGTGP
jgi:uncharacterized MAPEG superfamily protein